MMNEKVLMQELVNIRVSSGLSPQIVAERMGTGSSFIYRFERGCYSSKFRTIQRYAEAIGQQIDYKIAPALNPVVNTLNGNEVSYA